MDMNKDWYLEWEQLNQRRTRKLRIWALSFILILSAIGVAIGF